MDAKDKDMFCRYFVWHQHLESKDESNYNSADSCQNCGGCGNCAS